VPFISPDDGYLTVFNLFDTDTRDKQDGLLDAMRDIIDNAAYPGWISSTLHSGQDRLGTANYVQWRSREELEERYAGERFKNETIPLFKSLSTSVRLIKTEVVYTQTHPSLGGAVEIGPARDDYTVITVFGVAPENQKALVDVLAHRDEHVLTLPGYRSHSILRGVDGTYVVNYAQWDDRRSYERFHTLPEDERPADARRLRAEGRSLMTSRWSNTYQVVHSRSAATAGAES